PAARALDVVLDFLQAGRLELRAGRIGHLAEQVQLDLRAIVERAAELLGVGPVQAKAALEVAEAGPPADAERGAGEYHGGRPVVKQLVEGRANVDGRAGQVDALVVFAADVDPVHLPGQGLAQPVLQRVGQ